MDPNNGSSYEEWPQWSDDKQLMHFNSADAALLTDDFRSENYDWLVDNIASLYV